MKLPNVQPQRACLLELLAALHRCQLAMRALEELQVASGD